MPALHVSQCLPILAMCSWSRRDSHCAYAAGNEGAGNGHTAPDQAMQHANSGNSSSQVHVIPAGAGTARLEADSSADGTALSLHAWAQRSQSPSFTQSHRQPVSALVDLESTSGGQHRLDLQCGMPLLDGQRCNTLSAVLSVT